MQNSFHRDRNYTNTSPLQVAAVNGNSQIVQALLERGAATDTTTEDTSPIYLAAVRWANPLFIAKKEEYARIIKMLIDYGADINKCSICLQNIH